MAVILEDDVLLSDDFSAVIAAIEAAGLGFDLVKLESTHALNAGAVLGPDVKLTDTRAIRKSFQLLLGSAGYLVTRSGAEKLLEKWQEMDAGLDHYLFYPLNRKNFPAVPFGVVIPSVVMQDTALRSDISVSRFLDKRWQRDLRRAPYEAAQLWNILRGMVFQGARIVSARFEK